MDGGAGAGGSGAKGTRIEGRDFLNTRFRELYPKERFTEGSLANNLDMKLTNGAFSGRTHQTSPAQNTTIRVATMWHRAGSTSLGNRIQQPVQPNGKHDEYHRLDQPSEHCDAKQGASIDAMRGSNKPTSNRIMAQR